MNLEDLQQFLQSKKVSHKVNTKYHVAINLPDGTILDYYPTKSSGMIRNVDVSSSFISDQELINMCLNINIAEFCNSPAIKDTMVLKFKKLDKNAQPPHKTYITDGGIDLFSLTDVEWNDGKGYHFATVRTGIALEVPTGFMLVPAPRSSVLFEKHISPFVSVIDAGFLGEVTFLLFHPGIEKPQSIKKGDKVAQVTLIPIPIVDCSFEEVDNLPNHHSARGYSGFGSTGTSSSDSLSDSSIPVLLIR